MPIRNAALLLATVALLLATAALLLASLLAITALAVVAQEPSPSIDPFGMLERGDPRSEGGGPGLVGSPLLVLLGVITLGLSTAFLTVVLARLARRHR